MCKTSTFRRSSVPTPGGYRSRTLRCSALSPARLIGSFASTTVSRMAFGVEARIVTISGAKKGRSGRAHSETTPEAVASPRLAVMRQPAGAWRSMLLKDDSARYAVRGTDATDSSLRFNFMSSTQSKSCVRFDECCGTTVSFSGTSPTPYGTKD